MITGSVLIVDDDESIRDLYADAFELAGLTALKAKTGEEGVTLALQKHPNVILVDITMPGMDGHEVVRQIRQDAWGRNARIMYLTNLSDAANVVDAVQHKSDEYIVKANTDVSEVVNRARTLMYSVRTNL